jgi:hypothetical protein
MSDYEYTQAMGSVQGGATLLMRKVHDYHPCLLRRRRLRPGLEISIKKRLPFM